MKIGCVYYPRLTSGCGKFHFIADALRSLGHDVTHIQTNKELEAADEFCEFVLFEQRNPALLNIPDFLKFEKRRKADYIQQFFDLNVFDDSLPMAKQAPLEACLDFTRTMDLVLVKERDRLEDYRQSGIKAMWFDQGCPSAMRQAQLRDNPEFDVIVWGSAGRLWQQRWQDVEALVQAGFKVAWATTDGNLPHGVYRLPGCQPLELPDLIEQAKVALVVDARQDLRGFWSDRIWLAAGAGACIVRRLPTVDQHGSYNHPGMGYASHKVMIEEVTELCNDFDQRKVYGHFARQEVFHRGNLYEDRCRDLVKHAQRFVDERLENSYLPDLQGNQKVHQSRQEDSVPVLH